MLHTYFEGLRKAHKLGYILGGMVSPARFELTASELGILRSIQLSYEDIQVINQLNLIACQILLYKNTTYPDYEKLLAVI